MDTVPKYVMLYIFEFLTDEDIASLLLCAKRYYKLINGYVEKYRYESVETLHNRGKFIVLCKLGLLSEKYILNNSFILTKLLVNHGTDDYNSILINACKNNNVPIVNMMIKLGANDYNTSLYYACNNNSIAVMNTLIKRFDLNGLYGEYGLYGACSGNQLHLVKLLLKYGFTGCNMMMYACRSNSIEMVKFIAQRYTGEYDTGLHSACCSGNVEIVNMMLQLGATDYDYGLYCASGSGNVEIVKMMLALGANNYCSSMIYACERGNIEIVKMMLALGAYSYGASMREACKYNHIDIVNLLLDHGATNYNSGLNGACLGGHLHLVNMMLVLGATRYGSALYFACKGNYLEIVKLLVNYGADVNQCTYYNFNNSHVQIVNFLLKHKFKKHFNILREATMNGYKTIVKLLLVYNPKRYIEVLQKACLYNRVHIVKMMLVEYGVKPKYCINQAVDTNNIKIFRLLLESGIDVNTYGLYTVSECSINIVKLWVAHGAKDFSGGFRRGCIGERNDVMKLMIKLGVKQCNNCYRSVEEHIKHIL